MIVLLKPEGALELRLYAAMRWASSGRRRLP